MTVRNALRRYGIVRPRRLAAVHPELEDPALLEGLTANAVRSHNSIALELGVSPKTVTLAMRKAGVIE